MPAIIIALFSKIGVPERWRWIALYAGIILLMAGAAYGFIAIDHPLP